jgi:hypothetical protein
MTIPIEAIGEAGALVEWWRQLRDGHRTPLTFDNLWKAAALEARARDALRDGMVSTANDDRRTAASILVEAFTSAAA